MAIFILRTANGRFVSAGNHLSGDYTDAIEHTTITRALSAARRAVTKHGVTVNIFSGYGSAAETLIDVVLTPAPSQAGDSDRVPPCAAFMGCLCVGHANGVDPDDACDTNEDNYRKPSRKPRAPSYRAESSPGVRAGILIKGARDVYTVLDNIKAELKEHFVVIQLDTRGRIMSNRVVAIGSLTGVEVHPREVFKDAVIASAAAIIIAHNHPSGNTSPSPQDIQLTARLREAGDILGIPVVDHVIVSTEGFTSLAERGWK